MGSVRVKAHHLGPLLHDSAKLCNYDTPKRGEIERVRLQQANKV